MLAGVTDRTHFMTGTSRNVVAAWSVRPGEAGHTDASKPPDLPVRSP
jgi:hypothetical protein